METKIRTLVEHPPQVMGDEEFQEHNNLIGISEQVQIKDTRQRRAGNDVNLSFCGCGFLGIYHVGVASCFREYAPQLSTQRISGSSAGAVVAMAHICGNFQLAYCVTDFLAIAIEARSHTLGPFHPSFDIQANVRESLERGLPKDAWQMATGKLHVSLTRAEDGENVIINEFGSNEDLIQVLLCSCFIPFWSGIRWPKYKGVAYIDGGFSDNLLTLDDKTVTISPFVGEADICPKDDTLNIMQINLSHTSFAISPNNLYRLTHALLPPQPEILSDLCKQGFADGIRYLQAKNLISCTKCLEFRFSLLVSTSDGEVEEVLSINHGETSSEFGGGGGGGGVTAVGAAAANETAASLHHIILEQQEQQMKIEITERRSSFVSTKVVAETEAGTETTTRPGPKAHRRQTTRSIRPPLMLRNLLPGRTKWDGDSSQPGGNAAEADGAYCKECNLMRRRASYDPLPEQFSDRIRAACDKVNKSLSSWVYSHRPVKYLSYLMVPYYLPIDLTIAVAFNCWKKMPWIRAEVAGLTWHMLDALIFLLRRVQTPSTTSMLLGLDASWEENVISTEMELLKQHAQLRLRPS